VADGAEAGDRGPIAVQVRGPLAAPAFEYTLAAPAPVTLRLYAVRGGLVRTLVDATQASGRHAIPWNGRDDRGREVAAGGYYYALTTPAGSARGKLVLAR
jgi:flagellar hook assembly protein FlgD